MFNLIDCIMIILVIICIIIGTYRGFIRSITKLFGSAIKLVISFLLCKPVATLISNTTKIDERMFDKIKLRISEKAASCNANLAGLSAENFDNAVNTAITDSGVPKLFRGLYKSIFNIDVSRIADVESITYADICASTFTNLILIVISFILLFIVMTILIFILNKISKKILDSTIIVAKVDRLLGALVGALKGLFVVSVTFAVLYLFRNIGFLEKIYTNINNSWVCSRFYNLVVNFITTNVNIKELVIGWITKE